MSSTQTLREDFERAKAEYTLLFILAAVASTLILLPTIVVAQNHQWVSLGTLRLESDSEEVNRIRSVDAHGDVAVFGLPFAREDRGMAQVYRWNGQQWKQERTVIEEESGIPDYFGSSVAVYDDIVAITRWNYDDEITNARGAVHIYRWTGSQWEEEAQLISPDATNVGSGVDIYGDVAVTNGRCLPTETFPEKGPCILIYRRRGSSWELEASLESARVLGGFGSVAAPIVTNGTHVLIGDPNNSRVLTYEYVGGEWTTREDIESPTEENGFGYSVDLDNGTAVVGAPGDDSSGENVGTAFVFQFGGNRWVQTARLDPPSPSEQDYCGTRVAVSGDVLLMSRVSYPRANEPSMLVYRRSGNSWALEAELSPEGGIYTNFYGPRAAISGNRAFVVNDDGPGVAHPVVYSLPPDAQLSSNEISLDFSAAGETSIGISNDASADAAPLVWELADAPSWLQVSPASGYLAAGSVSTINLAVDAAGLEDGTSHTGAVTLRTNDPAEKDVEIPFTLNMPIGTSSDAPTQANRFSAGPAYPNPFRSTVHIPFSLPGAGDVSMTVHDLLGRKVAEVEEYFLGVGRHEIKWSPELLPNGTYVYRIEAGSHVVSGILHLVR